MKRYVVAGASALALALTAAPAVAQETSLGEQVANLRVAAESHGSSYNRDAFGDYDRDAILARNDEAFPNCEGYYSRYDAICYPFADYDSKEQADDEVDVDERVARAEAWRSGAWDWDQATLDQFGGDPGNLALMTSALNRGAKSDNDPTEWTPEHRLCGYVSKYVATKVEYDLAVDQAEKDALLGLAQSCSGTTPPATEPPASDNPPADDEPTKSVDQAADEANPDGTAPTPEPQEGHVAVTG